MNKNSKRRAEFNRKTAKLNRPRTEGGKMVISCNSGKGCLGGCERVYINEDANGKKFSVTRHEPVSNEVRWTHCKQKVGARNKSVGKVNA